MSIGIWQLILILVIVIIIFGAGKLPRAMGDVGKSVRSLRAGLKGEDDDTKAIDAKKDQPQSKVESVSQEKQGE